MAFCLKETLEEIGYAEKMPPDVRRLIGGGVRALLERVLGEEEFREEHVRVFRRHYLANPVINTRPYEGIPEVLEKLREKGFILAVVTNKMEDLSRQILRILGIEGYFNLVVGGDTYPEKKPSPLPLINALREMEVPPSRRR
ncbi:MAG: HAD hydrolase-like protein [Aquificota bacterium]|nr:HAD hydrolase-like protein [Aquificota bacterium]